MIQETPGWLIDRPDTRDALYGAFVDLTPIPDEFVLPQINDKIKNQLGQYSCVGESTARWAEYANPNHEPMSGRFLYAIAKLTDGQPNLKGTFARTVLGIAKDTGIAPESVWPDLSGLPESEYLQKPSQAAYEAAQAYKIGGYVTFQTVEEVKHYIYTQKLPVLIGINSNNSGWGADVVRSHGFVLQEPTGSLAGHFVVVVGYRKSDYPLENSWSQYWGLVGRAYVPYNYSGLQGTVFAPFNLPSDWKETNKNYRESKMTLPEINAFQYALYHLVRNADPKPEEMEIIKGRNNEILAALNEGGPSGQAKLDQIFKDFLPELKINISTGKI